MVDRDGVVATIFGADGGCEGEVDGAAFGDVEGEHAGMGVGEEGGCVVGFWGRAGAGGCDFVVGCPGWEAEIEGEGYRGGEGIMEAVAEGIGGVAGEIYMSPG